MMQRYETLLLTVPEITGDESANLESQLTKIVEKTNGAVLSFERWGKYRLAYPVKKNEYGVYFLYRYETEKPDEVTKAVKSLFTVKLNDIIMRDMTTQLDAKASLAYQKPPSLEDMPSRDVGTFLKENKMEGLLPKQEAKSDSAKASSRRQEAMADKSTDVQDERGEEVAQEEPAAEEEKAAPSAEADQEGGA